MRHLQTAGVAAAVALALGVVAHAATTGGTVSLSQRGTFVMTSPRIPGPANAAPTTTTGNTNTTTNTTQTPQNATTVDLRAQQNRQAVSSTFASGSQSSLGPLAGTGTIATGPFGAGTTGGAGVTGTATGTTTTTTTGVTTGGGVAAFGNVGTSTGVPIFANPSDFTTGVAPVAVASSTTPMFTNADVLAGASLAQNGIAVTESQVNAANVDRAIAQVSRDRKRVGRNGQLLYSLAPRTNVDRTWQMPDDGRAPSLTGSNSTLTR